MFKCGIGLFVLQLLGLCVLNELSNKNKRAKGKEYSAFDYNCALFEEFNNDLKKGSFPRVPKASKSEMIEYEKRREEDLHFLDQCLSAGEISKLSYEKEKSNQEIPVEIEIWVEKIYSHYFSELKPMLGEVHWCEGAKKQLYEYKGYTWYTISEIYPDICFD